MSDKKLEVQLAEEMLAAFHEAKRLKYNAARFFQMLSEKGALSTAKILLAGNENKISDGFSAMWSLERLDLTVEAICVQSHFKQLFTEQELSTARRRLENAGYKIDRIEHPNPDQSKIQPIQQDQRLCVFLCHSSGDKPTVRKLYQRLKKDGFAPWLDDEDLIPGQDWQQEIPRAVRNCHVVVVCLSLTSVNKESFIQKEIKLALDVADEKPDGTIFVIPARLQELDVPQRLARWQRVDLFQENGYAKLVLALNIRSKALGISQALIWNSSTIKRRILTAMTERFIEGKGEWTAFEFPGGSDDKIEKRVLAELRAEGSIEQIIPTLARLTPAANTKTISSLKAPTWVGPLRYSGLYSCTR